MLKADDAERKIHVPILTRVEGEGSLLVKIDGNVVRDVQLAIYEPPRLFEALLRGRPFDDVADFTARICGICPIAYQMTAVQALENAMGVSVSPEVRKLRRLMYCGEWIESHVLHIHLLHAPDFFGCDSGIDLAKRFPEEVKRGLRMKKFGNRLLEVLGGRAIHPVNLAVGGYYRLPRREELAALIPDFEWSLQAAIDTAKWLAKLPFPDFQVDYDFVALSHPDEYAIIDGRVVCSDGMDIAIGDYEQHFVEEQVPHSTALQSHRMPGRKPYFVGPLARVNLSRQQLSPSAQRVADEIGWETPCHNPYKGIVARALEVIHAFEEGLEILRSYRPTGDARAQFKVCEGHGNSATEAPRGLIYHRYHTGEDGKIIFAKIVPPTSQNQAQIESDLHLMLPSILSAEDDKIAILCERLIRNYDPCISCSTHFLKLRIERT
jgi:sulfhydrogenase subunit alpha